MLPKVSLIIATRNRTSYLKNLLNSLESNGWLSQDSVEVLVVDNAPSDSSTETLCSSYDSLKYLSITESGKTIALNYAVYQSGGELLAFIDDDVIVDNTNWLFKMANHFVNQPNLGYVSGNVKAFQTTTDAQKIWEKKGGLSKGDVFKLWFNEQLKNDYTLKIWPLTEIFAGANSMIPKNVLLEIGLFNPIFGPGAALPHGEYLELGYRIIKAGYNVLYDPDAKILHQHPESSWELRKKLFLYGRGDTSLHTYIFVKYFDCRSLWWAAIGHQLRIITRMFNYLMGQYPLPPSYLLFSLLGSILGPLYTISKLSEIPDHLLNHCTES